MFYISRKKTAGFTLLELLVVIAIIGFLASVVGVVLTDAKHKAWNTRTIAQNAEFGKAALMYQEENNGYYPSSFSGTTVDNLLCLGTGCKYNSTAINSSIALNGKSEPTNMLANPLSSYIPGNANTAITTYKIQNNEYTGTVYLCTESVPTNTSYCTKGYIIYPLFGQDCPLNAYYGARDGSTNSILCFQDIVTAVSSSAPKKGGGVGPILPSLSNPPNTPSISNPVTGGGGTEDVYQCQGTYPDCASFGPEYCINYNTECNPRYYSATDTGEELFACDTRNQGCEYILGGNIETSGTYNEEEKATCETFEGCSYEILLSN